LNEYSFQSTRLSDELIGNSPTNVMHPAPQPSHINALTIKYRPAIF